MSKSSFRAGVIDAMPAEPLAITFDDLYAHRGTLEMAFHPDLGALNGREVILTGVLAPDHNHHAHDEPERAHHIDTQAPSSSHVLVMDGPGQCPDCAPAPVATVYVSGLGTLPQNYVPGQTVLTIAGRFEFGYAVDRSGNASFIRIADACLAPSPERC